MVDVGDGGPEIFYRGNRLQENSRDIASIGPLTEDTEIMEIPDIISEQTYLPDNITVETLGIDRLVDLPIERHSLNRNSVQSRFMTPMEVEDGFYSEMSSPVQKPKPGPTVDLTNNQDSELAANYHTVQANKWFNQNVWKIFHEKADNELLDTIYSDAFQRLRFIDQHGPQSYRKNNPQVDRFEHSLGVMMLLRKFEAEKEEQLAALIHDIGHGPFSHWSEYVLDSEDYEFHEKNELIKSRLESDGTANKLEQHGYNLDHLLNKENFPLLEQPKPDLCADRIDYFLRDLYFVAGQEVSSEIPGPLESEPSKEETKIDVQWQEIVNYVNNMDVHESEDEEIFVVENPDVAVNLAERYIELDRMIWSNPLNNMAQYRGVADAAVKALSHGDVSEEEFFAMKDLEVLNSFIPRYEDSREHMQIVNDYFTKENLQIVEDEDADLNLETYGRWVDPKVREYEDQPIAEMRRASDYSPLLEEIIMEQEKRSEEGVSVNVEGVDYQELRGN